MYSESIPKISQVVRDEFPGNRVVMSAFIAGIIIKGGDEPSKTRERKSAAGNEPRNKTAV